MLAKRFIKIAIMEGRAVPCLQESSKMAERRRGRRGGTSHNAVISRIIHTLRSKEIPLSGWLCS